MALSRRLRFEILRRDGHACRYCGAMAPDTPMTVDHVIPLTLGGTDDPSNLVAACADCNSGKASVPADAPLVAQVAEDAVRWKLAIEQARLEFEAERQYVNEQLDKFGERWNAWGYNVEVDDPPVPLDTGDPLLDHWHDTVGFYGRYSQPVGIDNGVLTVKAKRGYTREVRHDVTDTLPRWTPILGFPLTSVVVEPTADIVVPPFRPRPTTHTERQQIPLDANWRESVTRFLSHGLTYADLDRLITITMHKSGLRLPEAFTYFCGCAWREITDLQESARRILESEGQ